MLFFISRSLFYLTGSSAGGDGLCSSIIAKALPIMQNFSSEYHKANSSCFARMISFKKNYPKLTPTDLSKGLTNIACNCTLKFDEKAVNAQLLLASLIQMSLSDLLNHTLSDVPLSFPISCVSKDTLSIATLSSQFQTSLVVLYNSLTS